MKMRGFAAGAALALTGVQSRKNHSGLGPFDLMIVPGVPITTQNA